MIDKLSIKRFRSHLFVEFKNCNRINLVLGRNNAGKTEILEALFLLMAPPNSRETLALLNEQRGYQPAEESPELWDSCFHNWDSSEPINIAVFESDFGNMETASRSLSIKALVGIGAPNNSSSIIEGSDLAEKTRGLEFSYEAMGEIIHRTVTTLNRKTHASSTRENDRKYADRLLPVAFIPTRGISNPQDEAERYSRLEKARLQDEVVEALRVVEPRLKRLTVLASGNGSMIYGDLGGSHLIPVSLMGEGLVRMLSIAMAIVANKGGLVLIDEIENGLHYSVLPGLWRMIFETTNRLDVQVFAATHNDECIRAASQIAQASTNQQQLRLFRLDLIKEETRVTDYDADVLAVAIASEQEVR